MYNDIHPKAQTTIQNYSIHHNRFQNSTARMSGTNTISPDLIQPVQININPLVYKWSEYFKKNFGFEINSNFLQSFSNCTNNSDFFRKLGELSDLSILFVNSSNQFIFDNKTAIFQILNHISILNSGQFKYLINNYNQGFIIQTLAKIGININPLYINLFNDCHNLESLFIKLGELSVTHANAKNILNYRGTYYNISDICNYIIKNTQAISPFTYEQEKLKNTYITTIKRIKEAQKQQFISEYLHYNLYIEEQLVDVVSYSNNKPQLILYNLLNIFNAEITSEKYNIIINGLVEHFGANRQELLNLYTVTTILNKFNIRINQDYIHLFNDCYDTQSLFAKLGELSVTHADATNILGHFSISDTCDYIIKNTKAILPNEQETLINTYIITRKEAKKQQFIKEHLNYNVYNKNNILENVIQYSNNNPKLILYNLLTQYNKQITSEKYNIIINGLVEHFGANREELIDIYHKNGKSFYCQTFQFDLLDYEYNFKDCLDDNDFFQKLGELSITDSDGIIYENEKGDYFEPDEFYRYLLSNSKLFKTSEEVRKLEENYRNGRKKAEKKHPELQKYKKSSIEENIQPIQAKTNKLLNKETVFLRQENETYYINADVFEAKKGQVLDYNEEDIRGENDNIEGKIIKTKAMDKEYKLENILKNDDLFVILLNGLQEDDYEKEVFDYIIEQATSKIGNKDILMNLLSKISDYYYNEEGEAINCIHSEDTLQKLVEIALRNKSLLETYLITKIYKSDYLQKEETIELIVNKAIEIDDTSTVELLIRNVSAYANSKQFEKIVKLGIKQIDNVKNITKKIYITNALIDGLYKRKKLGKLTKEDEKLVSDIFNEALKLDGLPSLKDLVMNIDILNKNNTEHQQIYLNIIEQTKTYIEKHDNSDLILTVLANQKELSEFEKDNNFNEINNLNILLSQLSNKEGVLKNKQAILTLEEYQKKRNEVSETTESQYYSLYIIAQFKCIGLDKNDFECNIEKVNKQFKENGLEINFNGSFDDEDFKKQLNLNLKKIKEIVLKQNELIKKYNNFLKEYNNFVEQYNKDKINADNKQNFIIQYEKLIQKYEKIKINDNTSIIPETEEFFKKYYEYNKNLKHTTKPGEELIIQAETKFKEIIRQEHKDPEKQQEQKKFLEEAALFIGNPIIDLDIIEKIVDASLNVRYSSDLSKRILNGISRLKNMIYETDPEKYNKIIDKILSKFFGLKQKAFDKFMDSDIDDIGEFVGNYNFNDFLENTDAKRIDNLKAHLGIKNNKSFIYGYDLTLKEVLNICNENTKQKLKSFLTQKPGLNNMKFKDVYYNSSFSNKENFNLIHDILDDWLSEDLTQKNYDEYVYTTNKNRQEKDQINVADEVIFFGFNAINYGNIGGLDSNTKQLLCLLDFNNVTMEDFLVQVKIAYGSNEKTWPEELKRFLSNYDPNYGSEYRKNEKQALQNLTFAEILYKQHKTTGGDYSHLSTVINKVFNSPDTKNYVERLSKKYKEARFQHQEYCKTSKVSDLVKDLKDCTINFNSLNKKLTQVNRTIEEYDQEIRKLQSEIERTSNKEDTDQYKKINKLTIDLNSKIKERNGILRQMTSIRTYSNFLDTDNIKFSIEYLDFNLLLKDPDTFDKLIFSFTLLKKTEKSNKFINTLLEFALAKGGCYLQSALYKFDTVISNEQLKEKFAKRFIQKSIEENCLDELIFEANKPQSIIMIFEEFMQNDKVSNEIKKKLFAKIQKILDKDLEKINSDKLERQNRLFEEKNKKVSYKMYTTEQIQKFNTDKEELLYMVNEYKQLENIEKIRKERQELQKNVQELNNYLSSRKLKTNIILLEQKIRIKRDQDKTEIYIDINKEIGLSKSIQQYYQKNSSRLKKSQNEILKNVVSAINVLERTSGVANSHHY